MANLESKIKLTWMVEQCHSDQRKYHTEVGFKSGTFLLWDTSPNHYATHIAAQAENEKLRDHNS